MKLTLPFTMSTVIPNGYEISEGLASIEENYRVFEFQFPVWSSASEGFLSADCTDLKFEFRTTDDVIGWNKWNFAGFKIPIERIWQITFRKQWSSGCSIVIWVYGAPAASKWRSDFAKDVALFIARKHREAAAEFVSSVQLAVDAAKKKN
jgi:hypothetical protein